MSSDRSQHTESDRSKLILQLPLGMFLHNSLYVFIGLLSSVDFLGRKCKITLPTPEIYTTE